MQTEIGEYIVGAYLKYLLNCDVVDYNVRDPNGGLIGLNEIDVIGLRFSDKTAFICEVTTHTSKSGINKKAELKMLNKFTVNRNYSIKNLKKFNSIFMLWSPKINSATLNRIMTQLDKFKIEYFVNQKYLEALVELNNFSKVNKKDTSNPFIRFLQILNSSSNNKTRIY